MSNVMNKDEMMKEDDYKALSADERNKLAGVSLHRKMEAYRIRVSEREKMREEDATLSYSQIVKAFHDAEKKVKKLKDEPKKLENEKRAALIKEYDEAVKRGLTNTQETQVKELWVSRKFIEWENTDEKYLQIKNELEDAGRNYNRYLALKVSWEDENADIIEAERVRTKRAELLQADPETLKALGITPDPTFEANKTTTQIEAGENLENIRATLKSIHPSATDEEIEGMLKSV